MGRAILSPRYLSISFCLYKSLIHYSPSGFSKINKAHKTELVNNTISVSFLASLVCQRLDDVMHRVVTCLGCGWRTFVLRAHNAAQPPASLASHMSHCAGRGGRLAPLTPLPPTLRRPSHNPPKTLVSQLTADSSAAGEAFAARFPTVRGFAVCDVWNNNGGSVEGDEKALALKRLKYQSPLRTNQSPAVSTTKIKHEVDENRFHVKREEGSAPMAKKMKPDPSPRKAPSDVVTDAPKTIKLINGMVGFFL